jgi:gas vesicle protein
MADGTDRDEHRGAGVGLVTGLLVGTVFGLGLGILPAPKSGSELRGQIRQQAQSLRRRTVDQSRRAGERASEWAARGRHLVDRGRDAVSRGVEEARRSAGATTGERVTHTLEEVPPRSPER